ncbi:hypothetical protein [Methylovulum psychrotolerans]|uniref:Uncharacterized protein n=1 Tax=Methylovulum psychrotolerans TaxID=1704499 RepID=A0A2S5CQ18_9GAMM|nr:hypothetical protein [Methylovulum psychrotolerans]POZ52893.1 hypothetical protein AADEFJLK_01504 [Methylovulum psychrotolerans]
MNTRSLCIKNFKIFCQNNGLIVGEISFLDKILRKYNQDVFVVSVEVSYGDKKGLIDERAMNFIMLMFWRTITAKARKNIPFLIIKSQGRKGNPELYSINPNLKGREIDALTRYNSVFVKNVLKNARLNKRQISAFWDIGNNKINKILIDRCRTDEKFSCLITSSPYLKYIFLKKGVIFKCEFNSEVQCYQAFNPLR